MDYTFFPSSKMSFVFFLFIFLGVTCASLATSTKDHPSEELDFLNHYQNDMEPLRQIVTSSLIVPERETEKNSETVSTLSSQSFFIPTRQTVMELTTTTSTITCTKSVANKCVRQRQRPSLTPRPARPTRLTRPVRPVPAASPTVEIFGEQTVLHDSTITSAVVSNNKPEQPADPELLSSIQEVVVDEEVNDILVEVTNEDHEQFPIVAPSAIQKVSSTKLPKLRESQVVDPQLHEIYGNQPENIESGFLNGPYRPAVIPFSRRYQKPDWPVSQRYGGGSHQQRQFIHKLFKITRKSTIFEIDILTVTPTCAEPGRIPQCPSEKKRNEH